LVFNLAVFVMILMHKNGNIKLAVVDIGIVVIFVVFAGATLLTLGKMITSVNFSRQVMPNQKPQQEQQNQNENVVLSAAAANITTTSSASETPPIPIIINDSNLKAEVVFKGIEFPTSMAFLGPDDILVLEKNNGTVRRIVNGVMLPEPLLDVNVANKNERGMLGIAVAPPKHHDNNGTTTYVFLYYTEASGGAKGDGTDDCSTATRCNKGNNPLGNRLYRYELVGNKLVNPKLLLDLPATPGPSHNGGKIVIGPADNNLYVVIGEVTLTATQASNRQKGLAPDGRGGILRITQDGQAVGGGAGVEEEEKGVGILGNSSSSVSGGNLSKLNLYYAYGIRNSFGIDFDPVTGNLWDSENGPSYGDEINLVYPGFNSGWRKVQGIWEVKGDFRGNIVSNTTDNDDNNNNSRSSTSSLVGFGGKGKYSVPKFVWNNPVAPTAVKFLSSSKLGVQYENDLFVGDANNGNIYHFDLNNNNKNRTELVLKGPLTDKVADNISENKDIIWAKGFRIITDIQVGPYDGYLYVLSLNLPHDRGTIYRIVPRGE
jgi:glucose/arabinose dehydrogenase